MSIAGIIPSFALLSSLLISSHFYMKFIFMTLRFKVEVNRINKDVSSAENAGLFSGEEWRGKGWYERVWEEVWNDEEKGEV